jgi:hypothetical protein
MLKHRNGLGAPWLMAIPLNSVLEMPIYRYARAFQQIPNETSVGATRSPEITMFGFQGGESADVVARKKDHMRDAQERWHFLTNFDCSTIRNEGQLSAMVQVRASLSEEQAKQDVGAWMRGRQF